MTTENTIIEHANKLAKGLYMYDQDNPIDNLTDALTMITFDSLNSDEVDSSEIYDCIKAMMK